MQNSIVLLLTLLISCGIYPYWNIVSGACRVDKGITVPIDNAMVTFRDGSFRILDGIDLRYEYVYEADKRFYNPTKHRANKKELFIGVCHIHTAADLYNSGKEISKVSLEFEAEYSYMPYKVRLLLTNGREYVLKGDPSDNPLVPPYDFLTNKSEGVSAPEVTVFHLLLIGVDAESKKTVSAVLYDATEHHDPDIQIMSIELKTNK